jgi:hypothetical protein
MPPLIMFSYFVWLFVQWCHHGLKVVLIRNWFGLNRIWFIGSASILLIHNSHNNTNLKVLFVVLIILTNICKYEATHATTD